MGILVVTGTGTEIGKTHLGVSILERAGRTAAVLGYKPIESGCGLNAPTSDHALLAAASTFHVKHPPEYLFGAPISPHLAARLEGRRIDLDLIVERVAHLATQVEGLLVELAGGLFSPLNEASLNVQLLVKLQHSLPASKAVLVVPDRLGVLHDVGSTVRAAKGEGARLDAILLAMPASPDASTGTNAAELALLT
ncbi:MAG: dethiobiotin synthase, partial [Polyangiaceae bacterium]